MIFLADMLGTTWFFVLSCGVAFIAGIALSAKVKNWFSKK